MIDYHKEIATALGAIAPTYYELFLKSGLKTPCLSYMELNNAVEANGNTLGYSRISYQIKVWDTNIKTIQTLIPKVDKVMRGLGFNRTASAELADPNSSMIQKILTFEAIALEDY